MECVAIMFRSLALLFILAYTCEGANNDIFRNCSGVEFCNVLRSLKLDSNEQFAADVENLKIRHNNTATIPLFNGKDETLNLQVTIGKEHRIVRLKVLEVNHTRFEVPYVLDGEPEIINITSTSNQNNATLTTVQAGYRLQVVVERGPPFTVEFYNNGVLVSEFSGERLVMRNTSTSKPFTFDINFRSVSALYGLSQHAFDLMLPQTVGSKDPIRLKNVNVFDYEVNDTLGLHGSVPVLYAHSTNLTSGVYVNNAAEQWIDLDYGDDTASAYFMVETGTLDLFVLLGPSPNTVVKQFTGLTGTSHMPQLWVFGYHQSRSVAYVSQEDAKDVVANMDNNDFPMDVLWLDYTYSNYSRYFEWNPKNFSDPIEMQNNISASGRRIVLASYPHIKVDDDYAVYAMAKGKYFIRWPNQTDYEGVCLPGFSSYIDFLDPNASDYYSSWYSYDKFKGSTSTIAGSWNDMDEPTVIDGASELTLPSDVLHHGDVEHRNIHNMYGFLHVRATHKGLLDRDNNTVRPFILTGSHFAGSQRYAAMLTGGSGNTAAWPFIRLSYSQCLTASILAMPICGTDIGGFYGDESEVDYDLIQRWYQAAIWLTFLRANSDRTTSRREPYFFPKEVQEVIRHAIKLRYKHIPVYYTLMYRHIEYGEPIIRPLFYEYPSMLGYDDHLLVGTDILVRPVMEPNATSVTVSLPGTAEDIWYRVDDESWTSYPAGSSIELPVDIKSSPYFYRGGSIIVRKDKAAKSTTDMLSDTYTLYVNLNKDNLAGCRLYVDDYYSLDYIKYKFFYVELSYITETHGLRVRDLYGDSDGINVSLAKIVINAPTPPNDSVRTAGKPLRLEHTAARDGRVLGSINIADELRKRSGNFVINL